MMMKILHYVLKAVIFLILLIVVMVSLAVLYHQNSNYMIIIAPVLSCVIFYVTIRFFRKEFGDDVMNDVNDEYLRHRLMESFRDEEIKGFYPFKEYKPLLLFNFRKLSEHSKSPNYYLDKKSRAELVFITVTSNIVLLVALIFIFFIFGKSGYFPIIILLSVLLVSVVSIQMKNKLIRKGYRKSDIVKGS